MKRGKPTLWTLLTDGLLLFLALISTVFGVVTLYHVEVVPAALWAGAAAVTPAALLLVQPRRHNVWYFLAAALLWLWGLRRLWEPLVWGGVRLECDVVNTLAAKLPGMSGIAPVTELPDALWPQVATLWLLMVGCVYALVLALLLCRLRQSLPAILWMLLPILPGLCVTEAPDSVPMAGMLAVWLTLILTSLTARRDPRGTARLRPIALICALLVLQGMCRRLPTQGTDQPLWAADLREAVVNEASRGDFSALLTRWSGWVGAGSTEYMNLLGNSPAQTGRVALRVEASQGGKYYLRGYSADIYTGRRWEPLGREARRELEAIRDTGVEPLLMLGEKAGEASNFRYESYRNGTTTVISGDSSATMTVENVAAPGGCIYYPYGLAELPENARFGGDSHLERTGAVWEHSFTFYPGWENVDLWGASVWSRHSYGRIPPQRGGEEDTYRQFVYSHELQVPEDLRPILEDWLRQATGEVMAGYYDGFAFATLEEYARYVKGYENWRERINSQMYDIYAAQAGKGDWNEAYYQALVDDLWKEGPTREDFDGVELTEEDLDGGRKWFTNIMTSVVTGYLAQTTHYDRDTPAPPADRDYVDWFLNESKQGYCMHYATAATLLLRTAGIPARYVSGYVTWVPYTRTAEVTDHAAHAWVEVYLDGVGWYPLEVTPGFQNSAMGDIPDLDLADAQATIAPSARPTPSPSPTPSRTPEDEEEREEPTPSAAPTPSQKPENQPGPGMGEVSPIPAGVWYALGSLLVLALAVWGRRYLLDRRRRKLRGEDTNAAVLWAYACHRRLKPWGGRESEELTALAEKARFSQHTLTQAERDRAAALFESETRRVREELPGWKKPLYDLLWGR